MLERRWRIRQATRQVQLLGRTRRRHGGRRARALGIAAYRSCGADWRHGHAWLGQHLEQWRANGDQSEFTQGRHQMGQLRRGHRRSCHLQPTTQRHGAELRFGHCQVHNQRQP
ncbi:hypothetical protein G6F68_016442 [Rhizopus microsporus]|nr:hypothetical protein G6F68_016442 [Rhizopus microsporus]